MGFHCYRRPKTTQELRRAHDQDERQYIRGRRLPNRLPNNRDDIVVFTTKCWKKTRKTQYKPKDV